MPDVVVLKNKDSKIPAWVAELPLGADRDAFLASWEQFGWSEDKKTDPADVPPPAAAEPVLPVSTNS